MQKKMSELGFQVQMEKWNTRPTTLVHMLHVPSKGKGHESSYNIPIMYFAVMYVVHDHKGFSKGSGVINKMSSFVHEAKNDTGRGKRDY